MPNELGLLTKQEAKNIRDINTMTDGSIVRYLAKLIAEVQQAGDTQTHIEVNWIVMHKDAVKYFTQDMGYTAVTDDTGQPNNYTRLRSISWAI